MPEKADREELTVLARGAYGASSSVPVSQLKEWMEEQKLIEQECPREEMQKKMRAFAARFFPQETEKQET